MSEKILKIFVKKKKKTPALMLTAKVRKEIFSLLKIKSKK